MKTVSDLKAFLEGLPDDAYVATMSFMGRPQTFIVIPDGEGYVCKQIDCPVISPYKGILDQLK